MLTQPWKSRKSYLNIFYHNREHNINAASHWNWRRQQSKCSYFCRYIEKQTIKLLSSIVIVLSVGRAIGFKKGAQRNTSSSRHDSNNSNNNMASSSSALLLALTGLVQRLASTIPKNNETSLLRQLLTNLQTKQSIQDLLLLTCIVVIALEILSKLVYHVPRLIPTCASVISSYMNINSTSNNHTTSKNKSIPVRGKHLDNFTIKDYTFIMINKCMTGLFVYCYFGYLWSRRKQLHHQMNHHGHHNCCHNGGQGIFSTNLSDYTVRNTLLPLPFLFLTYDFFYTLLHWFLHLKSIYAYIHKHHHYQKAPSRANVDAVNVHPLEFFLGEFNHILTLGLVLRGVRVSSSINLFGVDVGDHYDEKLQQPQWALLGYCGMDISWVCAVLFIGLGGILAGLNHTRHDVVLSFPSTLSSSDNNNVTADNVTDSNKYASSSTTKSTKKYWTIFDSKHHDVHHRIPQSNYGQYTVFWDRIF